MERFSTIAVVEVLLCVLVPDNSSLNMMVVVVWRFGTTVAKDENLTVDWRFVRPRRGKNGPHANNRQKPWFQKTNRHKLFGRAIRNKRLGQSVFVSRILTCYRTTPSSLQHHSQ